MRDVNHITGEIIDAAVKIHKQFGPGLLESVYEKILMTELGNRGLFVECQKPLPLTYAGKTYEDAYRIDLLVERSVIVELKSISQMAPVFFKQLRTYLVLSNLEVGLLLNFGMSTMKDGILRVVNNYKSCSAGEGLADGDSHKEWVAGGGEAK